VAVHLFDSSAIVKRYSRETGTAWVRTLTDPTSSNIIYLARITEVEVVCAISRQAKKGSISATDAASAITRFCGEFASRYKVVEITSSLTWQAMQQTQKHHLRAYDAVQLAAALQVNNECLALGISSFMLISSDIALNTAAAAEGLAVDDPNNHP
jgi:predicted nucleic acid-binding protein